MGTSTRAVTPMLFVGGEPRVPHRHAATADEAVSIIKTENIAALVDDFDVAADVLRIFGYSETLVEDRLHFARTGRVLHNI